MSSFPADFLQGTTVLHLASQSGHLDVLQRLLAATAAPDLADLQGRATKIDRKTKLIAILFFVPQCVHTYDERGMMKQR